MKFAPAPLCALALLANSAHASTDCATLAKKAASPEFFNLLDSKFQQVHGIKLDWNEVLEVSDDQEGSNCVFSLDRGHSIRVPLEEASYTCPNKYCN